MRPARSRESPPLAVLALVTVSAGAWAPRSPRAALPWLLAVAALHLLMLLALSQLNGVGGQRDGEVPARVTYLRLLASPAPLTAAPAAHRPPPLRARPVAPPNTAREAATITLPAPIAALGAPNPMPSADPPLNLRLPGRAASAPPTLASQVLNDPRVATRSSAGQRFAQTLGTDTTLHEDRLADGALRLRRGTDCVILSEAATTRLDPFSQTYAPTPRLAGRCP